MILKRKKILLTLGFIILMGSILSFVLYSNKPKGIDTNPLYDLQIPNNINFYTLLFGNDLTLAKKYNCRLYNSNYGEPETWISIPIPTDTNEYIFREIELWNFKNFDEALKKYVSYKEICESGFSSKRYKEGKTQHNRYFITYEAPKINSVHGIPCGFYKETIINIGFLLNTCVVFYSYDDCSMYSSKNINYIDSINKDIIFASKLFNEILGSYPAKHAY